MSPGRTALALAAAVVWMAPLGCGPALPPGWGPGKGPKEPPDQCTPPFVGAATVLANGLESPKHLATDGVDLYFTQAGMPGFGKLSKVPLAGGATTDLASAYFTPDALAVDDQYVFLLDEAGLWRVNKTTLQETVIAPVTTNVQSGETAVVIAGDELVVASGLELLYRMQKDGTGQVELHQAPLGGAIKTAVVDGAEVFFLVTGDASLSASTGLYRVPLDGSTAAVRLHPAPQIGRGLAVGPDAFVWAEGAGFADGAIKALDRTDLTTVVVLARNLRSPTHPVRSGAFVYFQTRTDPQPEFGPSELFLRRTSPCDPTGAPVVGPMGYGAGDVLIEGGSLYFSSVGVSREGYVGRVP